MEANSQLHKRISVVGSLYSQLSQENVYREIQAQALAGRPGYVCVSNVHTTMMGFWDPSYQHITNRSSFSVPDGMPLVWAMRSLGAQGQNRVRGPTLMRDLVNLGREKKLRHYLYGGSPKAVDSLKVELVRLYPGAEIVGAESPPFRPLSAIPEAEWEAIARRINASGAQVVWVGLGAPKQEQWMWLQRNRVNGVMIGVGAAFDLLSGRIPEAPDFLQRLGLEWAYRFYREPARLWKRYVYHNPVFLVLWAWQWGKEKMMGAS